MYVLLVGTRREEWNEVYQKEIFIVFIEICLNFVNVL